MKKIALFGGTFNPVHTGHIKIIEYCYRKLNFDEVWVILNSASPFKNNKDKNILSWDQRAEMLKLAIVKSSFPERTKIINSEKSPTEINYTYNTVKKIQNSHQDCKFTWILGQDLINTLEKWHNFKLLINIINFICFYRNIPPRMITNEESLICAKYNISLHSYGFINISSTRIRNGVDLHLQIPVINDYINENALYTNPRLLYAHSSNIKRLFHAQSVANMAVKLAQLNNYLDINKAYLAGMLHDITKYWSGEKQIATISSYEEVYLIEHPKTYHAITGSIYIKQCLMIIDQSVINAVKFHTIGSVTKMDLLAIIIYVADKISLDRDYENIESLRLLAFENLKACFITIIAEQYKSHKHTLNPRSKVHNIYEYWTNYTE